MRDKGEERRKGMVKRKWVGNHFAHRTCYSVEVLGCLQGVQDWSVDWVCGVVLPETLALNLTEEVPLRRKITYCTNLCHEVR